MSGSFKEDLEYLGKILLMSFFIASLIVIYNQKFLEGIILFSLACQILILWILVEKYDLLENITTIESNSSTATDRIYLYLVAMIITFITGLFFIFRAIIMIQQSFSTYGSIKYNLYDNIIIDGVVGAVVFSLFILFTVLGKKYIDKRRKRIMIDRD